MEKFKREIYVGIITSIIISFLVQPAIQYTSNAIFWAGTHVYSGFLEYIYRSAAYGYHEYFSFQTHLYTLTIISSVLITLQVFNFTATSPNPKVVELFYTRTISNKMRWFVLLSILSFVLITLAEITTSVTIFKLNTSFNQNLTILAPNISEQQLKELKAQWSSMNKRQDYVSIQKKIEMLALEKKIVLPKQSSFWSFLVGK